MIECINLLRNIGQFDSVAPGAVGTFEQTNLIYADNGRGKTTLAAILRSYGTGDPNHILERIRLGSTAPPHVVLKCGVTQSTAQFNQGSWNKTLPGLLVFDDIFIEENVYSGLEIGPSQKRNLHEVIVGKPGVDLARAYKDAVERVKAANQSIQIKRKAIAAAMSHQIDVDEYCALAAHSDVDEQIESLEKELTATRNLDLIASKALLEKLWVPPLNPSGFENILRTSLQELDSAAVEQVKRHLDSIGPNGRRWIEDGLQTVDSDSPSTDACPFCAQDLARSPILTHYRAYFSLNYMNLLKQLDMALDHLQERFSDQKRLELAKSHSRLVEGHTTWSKYCDLAPISFNLEEVDARWFEVYRALSDELGKKRNSPLEARDIEPSTNTIIQSYLTAIDMVEALNAQVDSLNVAINSLKVRSKHGAQGRIRERLIRARAAKERHSPGISALCKDYLDEKQAKKLAEAAREKAKLDLDSYQTQTFPKYEGAVNRFLSCLGADFQLKAVKPKNSASGPSCSFEILVKQNSVSVGTPKSASPSFKTVLSAGDRSSLALAFFLTSVDMHPDKNDLVVVFDDPMSSLDRCRKSATMEQIKRLNSEVKQIVVLSHNVEFLCELWDRLGGSKATGLRCHEIIRSGDGSELVQWNVVKEARTLHDHRSELFRDYIKNGPRGVNLRNIAESLRPHLEHYLRVACPEFFPPGGTIGSFLIACKGGNSGIAKATLDELEALKTYANKFHHDANPAYQTESVTDGELQGYVTRVLRFTCV